MKVIFAGYSKCGTKTMNAALTELGYNCYDYMENYRFLGDEWMKIFKEGGTTEDFRRMFENVDAVMDIPCCFYWEEIHKAFPEAKIIFCERKNDDIWYKSLKTQFEKNRFYLWKFLAPSFYKFNSYGSMVGRIAFGIEYKAGIGDYNELVARKRYRSHNTYLLKNAPKDKLLVINFDDGWDPLCEFLGVPVPDTPFPHKNRKGDIVLELLAKDPFLRRLWLERRISGCLLVGLLGFGIYKLATRPSDSASLLSYVTSPVNALLEKLGYQ